MSDRIGAAGRQAFGYFLTGAILSSLALIAMPNASALMVAGCFGLRRVDQHCGAFRAFVADKRRGNAPPGFMQSLFIGLGAVVASGLP
jgi:maltose/moltooligosaccharide transporter